MRVMFGTITTLLEDAAHQLHQSTDSLPAYEQISHRLWEHIKGLEYTAGRFLVAGQHAEVLAGAPLGTPRTLEGVIDQATGQEAEDGGLLVADLPPAGQWPHHHLGLRLATASDLNRVDVAITNLPFNDIRTLTQTNKDLIANSHGQSIHDALDLLRPGGLLVTLAHRQVLETPRTDLRRSIAHRADLIAAVRLPASALRRAPLLDSPIDLLLLRHREPGHAPDGLPFIGRERIPVHSAADMRINACYANAPLAVLGNVVPDPVDPALTSVAPVSAEFGTALGRALSMHVDEAIDNRLYATPRPAPTRRSAPPTSTGREPDHETNGPGTPSLRRPRGDHQS